MDDFKGCIIRNFSVAIYYRNVVLPTQGYYYFAQFSGKIYSHTKESRGVIILVGCIAVHAIEESLILAPIFAMVTVGCAAVGLDTLNGKISRFFVFMGEHSLNIWLIHMFFYAYIFNNLVYRMVYPPLIYIFMFAICVGMSYIIKSITGLLGLIERRMIYSRGN